LFSLICRPELYEQVRKAINDNIHFESTLDAKESLKKAARVSSSVLILDADTGSAAEIVSGIKKYRVARPETRIILLAPGREPGDQLIASLVAKGVYDIIAPALPEPDKGRELDLTAELKRVLDGRSATYADAARWDIGGDEDDHKRENEIIYREKLIGTGYVVVTGAGRGAGSTTMAIAIAEYLAARRYKTALVEMNRYPVLWRVAEKFHQNIDLFMQAEEFCVCQEKLENLLFRVEGLYSYVVVDLGSSYEPAVGDMNEPSCSVVKWHEYLHEMGRASVPVLVLGSALWQWVDFLPLHTNRKIESHWHLVTPNKEAVKELKMYNNVHAGPTILNPFASNEETAIFLDKMLASIMPKTTKKKSRLQWNGKRGANKHWLISRLF